MVVVVVVAELESPEAVPVGLFGPWPPDPCPGPVFPEPEFPVGALSPDPPVITGRAVAMGVAVEVGGVDVVGVEGIGVAVAG